MTLHKRRLFNMRLKADGDLRCVGRKIRMTPFVLAAVCAVLLIPFVVMNAVRTDPDIAEWWTRNIAQGWVHALGVLTSILPFAVYELLLCIVLTVGAFLLVELVICLCKARFYAIITGALAVLSCVIYVLNLYIMSMGFGYYRAPMPRYMSKIRYSNYQSVVAVEFFLEDFNALSAKFERDKNGCVVCPYEFGKLVRLVREEYDKLDDDYFFSYTPAAKPVFNSGFLSANLITGVTFLPTGEASVNVDAPPTTVTYTMAHELAHAKGVQREGDANLISYYVLLSSDNDYLRYCGYYATFYSFCDCLTLTGDNKNYARLINAIDKKIDAEHYYTYNFWQSQPDIIGKIGEFFNNLYLKSNGVSNGTGSYDDSEQSGTVTPTDPDTGLPIPDPDTGKPIVIPVYSELQKTYFYIYEKKNGGPPAEKAEE